MSIPYFTKESYKTEYVQSRQFQKLRVMIQNRKCFICEKSNTILPHHIQYANLYHERLWRDIYPLCFECHTQVHFFVLLRIFKIKIPLKKFFLKRRMFYLRFKYCVQNRRYGSALWAGIRYSVG